MIRPSIACFGNNAFRSIEDTVEYMRKNGMPEATPQIIRRLEHTALRKLRNHPKIQEIYKEIASC